MSKMSRNKGQRGERKVAEIISDWWGADFTRTPSSGGFRTKEFREEWNAEGDLVTPDEDFPFSVECKWQEGWTFDEMLTAPRCKPWLWWEQTLDQTTVNKMPLLIFKRNRKPWFFMTMFIPVCLVTKCTRMVDSKGNFVYIGILDDLINTDPNIWK